MGSIRVNGISCAFTLLLSAACMQAMGASDNAVVNLTATVVNNTCTPQWSTAGETVAFNRVAQKEFVDKRVGATKQFTLSLTDCGSDAASVQVTAAGIANSIDNSLFANTVSGGATEVGIGLWGGSAQATQMKPDGSNSVEYAIANQKADMVFEARLMQAGSIVPGTGEFKSVITMTVSYL